MWQTCHSTSFQLFTHKEPNKSPNWSRLSRCCTWSYGLSVSHAFHFQHYLFLSFSCTDKVTGSQRSRPRPATVQLIEWTWPQAPNGRMNAHVPEEIKRDIWLHSLHCKQDVRMPDISKYFEYFVQPLCQWALIHFVFLMFTEVYIAIGFSATAGESMNDNKWKRPMVQRVSIKELEV